MSLRRPENPTQGSKDFGSEAASDPYLEAYSACGTEFTEGSPEFNACMQDYVQAEKFVDRLEPWTEREAENEELGRRLETLDPNDPEFDQKLREIEEEMDELYRQESAPDSDGASINEGGDSSSFDLAAATSPEEVAQLDVGGFIAENVHYFLG